MINSFQVQPDQPEKREKVLQDKDRRKKKTNYTQEREKKKKKKIKRCYWEKKLKEWYPSIASTKIGGYRRLDVSTCHKTHQLQYLIKLEYSRCFFVPKENETTLPLLLTRIVWESCKIVNLSLCYCWLEKAKHIFSTQSLTRLTTVQLL